MKRIFTLVLFIGIACSLAFAQSSDEETLRKLNQEFDTAMRTNDVAALERLVDSGYQGFNQFGQGNDRAAFLTLYKTMQTSALSTSQVKVKIIGDTALLSGKQHEKSTSNYGRDQHLMFLRVWVKRADGWKVLVKQQQFDAAEGTVTPHGWNGQSNHLYLIGTDTHIKRSGQASAFLKSKHNESRVGIGISQQIKANDYRGKRIRLSGYAKGENLGGIAFPWMRVDNAEGVTLSFDNTLNGEAEFDAFSSDWSKFEIVLDVPEQGFIIWIGFQLIGKGQAWLDDWQLEIVSKDVPSTHQAASEATEKALAKYRAEQPGFFAGQKMRQPKLPAAPVNLDFETPGKQ